MPVFESAFYAFQISKRAFLRFFELACQEVVGSSLVLNPSKQVHNFAG